MKVTHVVARAEVIVLDIPSADDATAIAEVRRQLPGDEATTTWIRSGTKVVVWPARLREKATAEMAQRGRAMNGARLADGILPGKGDLWLVPEKRCSLSTPMAWLATHDKAIAAVAATLLTVGLLVDRAAAKAEDRLVTAERARRKLDSARSPQSASPNRLALIARFGAAVPVNAHLVELSVDEATRGIRLRGRAADYAAVSAFARALATVPGVEAIRPGKAGLVKIGGTAVVEFTLEATLK